MLIVDTNIINEELFWDFLKISNNLWEHLEFKVQYADAIGIVLRS